MTTTASPFARDRSTPESRSTMDALLRERTPWMSLPAPFYTDRDLFDLDMHGIFGTHWVFAGSIAEIPEAGDYVTVDYGPHSLILIRTDDGDVNALHNVCRHRGARVLVEAKGSTGNLVCGYHSWTYAPDGTLLHASAPGQDFDKSCFALKRAHSRVVAGLIFVCLAVEPPEDFDEVAKIWGPYFAPHALGETKVAFQQDIIEEGNWKLVMENNRECYHCDGHPELACSLFPTWGLDEETVPPHLEDAWARNVAAEKGLQERCERHGLPFAVVEELDSRIQGFRISREPLDGEGESFSETGHRLSKKLLGDLPDFRLGRSSLHLQPNSWFHFLADHVITFAAFPLNERQTLVRTTWLVADDAVEGEDYDLDALTHVWKQTNLQDAEFVRRTQIGVSSPAYEPGPYMKSEYQVEAFISWYSQRMKEHLAR